MDCYSALSNSRKSDCSAIIFIYPQAKHVAGVALLSSATLRCYGEVDKLII